MSNKYSNLNYLLTHTDCFGDMPDYAGSRTQRNSVSTHDALQYYANHLHSKNPLPLS